MAAATEEWPSRSASALTVPSKRPELVLEAFGHETIRLGDRLLTPADFTYAKPRELLFYLAEHGPADKARIGLALWPEANGAELRSAFHTTLHHLRGAVGPDRVRYVAGRYQVDREQTRRTTWPGSARRWRPRVTPPTGRWSWFVCGTPRELYRGDFLATASPDWAGQTRDKLRDSYQRALLVLGRGLAAGGSHQRAVDAFRQALVSDPCSRRRTGS